MSPAEKFLLGVAALGVLMAAGNLVWAWRILRRKRRGQR